MSTGEAAPGSKGAARPPPSRLVLQTSKISWMARTGRREAYRLRRSSTRRPVGRGSGCGGS
eukprot:scaffold10693_cov90-Isochrysis_galbana.AAC.1